MIRETKPPAKRSVLDIYQFTDYRDLLKEWRKKAKLENSRISNEYICHKLSVSNRSYYGDLEKGTRRIGPEMMDRLCNLLTLKGTAANYFRALVGFGQAKVSQEKTFWFEQLIELNHTPKKIVDKDAYEYYRVWYHSVVRALLDTYECKGDWKDASHRLRNHITPNMVSESVHLLIRLGLAEECDGIYKVKNKVLTSGENMRNELLRQYQIAGIRRLAAIAEKDEPQTYNSTSLVLSLSSESLEILRAQMETLRSKIVSLANKDEKPAEHVVSFSMHLLMESD